MPQSAFGRAPRASARPCSTPPEALLESIAVATRRPRRRLKGEARIGGRAGKVIGRYKMAKHLQGAIDEHGRFSSRRTASSIAAEAALDGLYVVRASLPESKLNTSDTVRAYKRLATVERAPPPQDRGPQGPAGVPPQRRAGVRPCRAVQAGLLRGVTQAPTAAPDVVRRRG